MTLKEIFILETGNETFADNCEKIADDYAIEFASFIDKKYYQHKYDNNKYAESEEDFTYGKTYSIKQLLEIFKKEKGL
jgi:hypothetical protein